MRFLLLYLFLFATIGLYGQMLSGKITNEQNEPLAYATIYIEELQTGTCANQDGFYNLHLKPGNYHISFRLLGYTPQIKEVTINNSDIRIDLQLTLQSYILEGVTVRADNEDPAYSVMRKAIARAPQFANQAKSYSSEVYIKGMIKFVKLPKMLAKRMDINGHHPEEGETYVNESLNRIRFKAPDIYEQEVISVNNSFPVGENDVPVIGLMSGSIYETQEDFFISPLAPNAFAHYDFKYEGLLQDGDQFINRIRVIPKREGKLLMSGYLYIIDELWCLYSYDIEIRPMYTHLHIKQHYAPVQGNNYFPVNMYLEADMKALGAMAHATYTTTIHYDSLILNPLFARAKIKSNVFQTDTTQSKVNEKIRAKSAELDKKIEKLVEQPDINNRQMIELQKLMSQKAKLQTQNINNPLEIQSNYKQIKRDSVLIRDSVYWDSVRPVPASADEKISYQKADSIRKKTDSLPAYRKALNIILTGNYEWERKKKIYVYYPGLIDKSNVGFNPVDGFQAMQSAKIRWRTDSVRFVESKLMAGYSFEREKLFGRGEILIDYAPMHRGIILLKGGWLTNDFNPQGTPALLNGVYNLFLKENYKKFYDDKNIELLHRIEIYHGWESWIGLKWQQTGMLKNNTNFSFSYPNKKYKQNTPLNAEMDSSNLTPSKLLVFNASLTYHCKQFYTISNQRKRYEHTNYPFFTLYYQAGLGLSNSYSSFHQFEFSMGQDIDLYSVSRLKYKLLAGGFYKPGKLHFSAYRHFKTIEEPFTTSEFKEAYFLVDNYTYSTSKQYVEGHIKYTTPYLLIKRIPWISNQMWEENLYFNTLWVNKHQWYNEIGYSLSGVLLGGDIGAFGAFSAGTFKSIGVKISYNIQ